LEVFRNLILEVKDNEQRTDKTTMAMDAGVHNPLHRRVGTALPNANLRLPFPFDSPAICSLPNLMGIHYAVDSKGTARQNHRLVCL
jgi:hypothetical protein